MSRHTDGRVLGREREGARERDVIRTVASWAERERET